MGRRITFGLIGWFLLTLLAAIWAGACSKDTGDGGNEGDPCETDRNCKRGLVCENNTCVKPNPCADACSKWIQTCVDGECIDVAASDDIDGDGSLSGDDCDDLDWTVNPNAHEVCDGVDNDCDGETDEYCPDCENGDERDCGSAIGECETGVTTCLAGRWQKCSMDVLEPESCDGKDNDCDGLTDEVCPCQDGDQSVCGMNEGTCRAGVVKCIAGVWGECGDEGIMPVEEKCDGLDNDCDGQTDEGFNLGTPCCGGDDGCGVGSIECAGDWEMICSTAPGGSQPPILFDDDFEDDDTTTWKVVDQITTAGKSEWTVDSGKLLQQSNLNDGDTGGNCAGRKGTIFFWNDPNAMNWTDYRFSVKATNDEDDGIGVVFRYQDEDNFYRLDVDNDYCKECILTFWQDGTARELASQACSFSRGDCLVTQDLYSFIIDVEVRGNAIKVRKDGDVLFGGTVYNYIPNNLSSGTVGLYTWGSMHACFDDVVVIPICSGLMSDSFDADTLDTRWVTYNEHENVHGNWHDAGDNMGENCDQGEIDADNFCLGTIAYWNDPDAMNWTDYVFSVLASNDDRDGIGVVFRYQDTDNFYRLDLNNTIVHQRLTRRRNGVEEILIENNEVSFTEDIWFNLDVELRGNDITVRMNEMELFGGTVTDDGPDPLDRGTVGLFSFRNGYSNGAQFDNVTVLETCP